jgi:glutathione S-transferase
MLQLISATPSPYARKVRIALAEKGIPFTLLTDVPWDRGTSTPAFNPLEKVPILLLEDGTSVYESSFILQYLELTYPSPPLLPAETAGILAARKIEVLADGVCDALVLTFFERMREGGGSAQWTARQRRKIDGGLAEMSRLLANNEWIAGSRFGLGDIAMGAAVGYVSLRFPELPWAALHPNLASLHKRLEERPSFKGSVPYAQTITDKVI